MRDRGGDWGLVDWGDARGSENKGIAGGKEKPCGADGLTDQGGVMGLEA